MLAESIEAAAASCCVFHSREIYPTSHGAEFESGAGRPDVAAEDMLRSGGGRSRTPAEPHRPGHHPWPPFPLTPPLQATAAAPPLESKQASCFTVRVLTSLAFLCPSLLCFFLALELRLAHHKYY